MPDYELRDEIADLEASMDERMRRLTADQARRNPEFTIWDLGLNDAEIEALAMEIHEAADDNGYQYELDSDDLHELGLLSYELGGDTDKAFRLWQQREDQAAQEWEAGFQEQVEAKAEQLGRKITASEQDKLRDFHFRAVEAEGHDFDLDLDAAWRTVYGKSYTDDEIAAVEAEHARALEKMREKGYSEEHIDQHDRETRPQIEKRLSEMRASGKGAFDLDDTQSRIAYGAERAREADLLTKNEKFGLDPDSPAEDTQEAVVAEAAERMEAEPTNAQARVDYVTERWNQVREQEAAQAREGTADES